MSDGDGRPMLKVREIAERLNVTPMTVYRLIGAGKLKAVQIGRDYRVSETALAAFMLERETRG